MCARRAAPGAKMAWFPRLALALALCALARALAPTQLGIETALACPPGYGAICELSINRVAHFYADFGGQQREKRVCVGLPFDSELTGAADSILPPNRVSLFYDPRHESRRWSPETGTDIVDLNGALVRMPVAQALHASADTASCDALLPLGPSSPLWLFWRNITLSQHALDLGGVARVLGAQAHFDSQPLRCFGGTETLCATPVEILGETYTAHFWSGSSRLVVPAALKRRLTERSWLGAGSVDMLFPPPGLRLRPGACHTLRDAMGLRDNGVCDSDHSFRLPMPLDVLYGADAADNGQAQAITVGSDDSTVVLSTDVLRRLRIFYDSRTRHMVLAHVDDATAIGGWRLALFAFLAVVRMRHAMVETPHLWPAAAAGRIPWLAALTGVLEVAAVALSFVPYAAPATRSALGLAPDWGLALFLAMHIAAALGALFLVARSVERADSPGARAGARTGDPFDFFITERAQVAYSSLLVTTLYAGLLLLLLGRTPSYAGTLLLFLLSLLLLASGPSFCGATAILEHAVFAHAGGRRAASNLANVVGDRPWHDALFDPVYYCFLVLHIVLLNGVALLVAAWVWVPFAVRELPYSTEFRLLAALLALLGVAVASLFSVRRFHDRFYLGFLQATQKLKQ